VVTRSPTACGLHRRVPREHRVPQVGEEAFHRDHHVIWDADVQKSRRARSRSCTSRLWLHGIRNFTARGPNR